MSVISRRLSLMCKTVRKSSHTGDNVSWASLVITVDADSLGSSLVSAAVCNGYSDCVLRKCLKGAPSLTDHCGAARLEALLHMHSEPQRMICYSNHRAPLMNFQLVYFHFTHRGHERVTTCWNITLGFNTCSMVLWERSRYRRRSGWAAWCLLLFYPMEGTDPERGTEEHTEGNWSGSEEDGTLRYPGECHQNG